MTIRGISDRDGAGATDPDDAPANDYALAAM